MLCLVRSYPRPGLPRPATSRSSVEARSAGFALRRSLHRTRGGFLALGDLDALLQLLFLRLGLDDLRRHRHGREHDLRVVEIRDALARRQVGQTHRVAHRHRAHIELDALGHFERQRLDGDLADHLRQDAALLHTLGLSDQLDHDLRLDRLVEPHLLQVDVSQAAGQHVLLIVLQDRRMSRLLTVENDVEDRVEAAVTGEHAPQGALGNANCMRRLATPVEDAGDDSFASQPAGIRRSAALALHDLEPHSLSCHGARV
jgi:hypothetical protein